MQKYRRLFIVLLEIILALPYTSSLAETENPTNLWPVCKDGLYGFVDRQGRMVIPAKYEYAGSFSEGLAAVCKNHRYGFVDASGRVVVSPRYEYVHPFSEGYALVRKAKTFGFINKSGKLVITNRYQKLYPFSDGRALFCANGKWGFIDHQGKTIISARYEDALPFSEGLAAVCDKGKWGFINTQGNIVIAPQYQLAKPFGNGLAAVLQNGKWGFVDQNGNMKIQPKYISGAVFSEGLAWIIDPYSFDTATSLYNHTLIDTTGREIALVLASAVQPFREGLASVQVNDYLGYVGLDGQWVIAPHYSAIYAGVFIHFENGLARVQLPSNLNVWGFIDAQDCMVIQPQYDYYHPDEELFFILTNDSD